MLSEISIHNFAIIEELQLNFDRGLVVFTGETGAGKSIILDALDMVLGGKADQSMIRSGADRALIECVFEIDENNTALIDLLKVEELLEDGPQVILSREIRLEGRSTARVNGRAVSTPYLKEVGQYLVDIHGQTEHLSIFNPKTHIELLDRYADLEDIAQEYSAAYQNFTKVNKELSTIKNALSNAEERADLLRFQIDEIEQAKLRVGEDTELKQERDRLANAESLSDNAQKALQILDQGDYENPSLSDQLGIVSGLLNTLSKLDSSNQELAERSEGLSDEIADMIIELRDYADSIEFNPTRLQEVEERIDLISTLKRKYGHEIEDILQKQAKANEELESISTSDTKIQQLEELRQVFIRQLFDAGKNLSEKRKSAAVHLSQAVELELDDLKMSAARFETSIETASFDEADRTPNFDKTGFDHVEFMIAPNIGEGLKPLVKIASGGETSRLMLALKNTLARADEIPTLVFDEIDQGIGGRIGSIVGKKLFELSQNHQVFCVTHLPQLAAFGTQHYKVEKAMDHDRTTTIVNQISGEEQVNELAQMFGELSEGTLTSAREILEKAHS